MDILLRHTKIIATIGPATSDDGAVEAMIAAGTDVVRLNFSHGTLESHRAAVRRVRAASSRAGRPVAVMQDLPGPKIRTGALVGGRPVLLESGRPLRIVTGEEPGDASVIATTFAGLAKGVKPGDRLLLADGAIELRVDRTDGREIETTVVDGGRLGEHKGINAPGVALAACAVTEHDEADLAAGIAMGVDLVAVSFVQTADDIRAARRAAAAAGAPDLPIVAKLERPQALEHLDGILEASSAVMVARGDLGLEMPLEQVPRAQKTIIAAARRHGIPAIVATQVLESMTTEPRPTRAEVSDAAKAVDESVDAIMLAGETAIGAFPVRAVRTLDAVIRDAELAPAGFVPGPAVRTHEDALCGAAVTLAAQSRADAIVAVTRGGATARRLSSLRPQATIVAATEGFDTARRLALCWGVVPVAVEIGPTVDAVRIGAQLVERAVVRSGATIVVVSVNSDPSRDDANYLKLQRLP
jgi:pyruvate kinase